MLQLNDPVYYEEQRLKAEEEKRLAQEAEEKVIPCIPIYDLFPRRHTPLGSASALAYVYS
jgi:hypothetical protein